MQAELGQDDDLDAEPAPDDETNHEGSAAHDGAGQDGHEASAAYDVERDGSGHEASAAHRGEHDSGAPACADEPDDERRDGKRDAWDRGDRGDGGDRG